MKNILIFVLFISTFTISNLNSQTTTWAEKVAGTGNDYGEDIVTDKNGNVYVVGRFLSSTLTLNNSKSITNSGNYDIFLAKYNSTGLCQWAEKIAGTNADLGYGIAIDTNGNVFISGYFTSSTLLFNNGKSITNSGGEDAFLAKYNNSGICQWAEKISGTGNDRSFRISTDAYGNVFIIGWFGSPTLTFNNGKSLSHSGSWDAYLAKYNSLGTCQWVEKIAGTGDDLAYRILVDYNGNIMVLGSYNSSNLILNNGKSITGYGTWDIFLTKYNNNGTCQWG